MKKILTYLAIFIAGLIGLMALFPEQSTKLGISAERSISGLEYKTVVVGDETWHYLEGGPNDAEVVLLLHGFGGDKDNWTRFSKLLTDGYRVVAPDLPGFGESAGTVEMSAKECKQWVGDLLTALEIEQPVVVSPSMSGRVVLPWLIAESVRLPVSFTPCARM